MAAFKNPTIDKIDYTISAWMAKNAEWCIRISLAIIFIWFGALKPAGYSPAAGLVEKTVTWFPPEIFIPVLGWWEVLIGVFFLFKRTTRWAMLLLFLQMPGTFLPLILLPDVCYSGYPFGLTLESQYIIKNLIIISAAFYLGGTLRAEDRKK
ncbi:MAG TPA: DoxX family membrane protein [Candidatus Omnitrophota bacterium]|nr:DoxX family membrane protein [Candidatus Omnitrophota bacterium]